MMRYWPLILILLLLQGCKVRAGIGYQGAIPEEVMENPIGIMRVEHHFDEHHSVECQHITSIPMARDIVVIETCEYLYTF